MNLSVLYSIANNIITILHKLSTLSLSIIMFVAFLSYIGINLGDIHRILRVSVNLSPIELLYVTGAWGIATYVHMLRAKTL
jgi:hypothetical protein